MTDAAASFDDHIDNYSDTSAANESQCLSTYLWDDIKSQATSVCKGATDSLQSAEVPNFLDFSFDDLYGAGENMCRVADSSGTSFDTFVKSLDSAKEIGSTGDVASERKELTDLAEAKISDPKELAKFKADMDKLEKRATEQQPALSQQEISETYQEISRLLEAKDNSASPLKEADRVKLAEQVMDQAATPTSIDQGGHNTCTVTAIESLTYTRTPSEAARLVADVALTGKYTTKDGTVVEVPQSSISAADSEAQRHPAVDGERSHASQIFQVTAVNTYWTEHDYTYTDASGASHTVPAGQLKYEQVQPNPADPNDSGERLIDYSVKPPAVVMDYSSHPAVPLCGPQTDLVDDGAVKWMADKISGNNDALYAFHDGYENADGKGAVLFSSEKEMKEVIADAEKNGQLPMVFAVHTAKEPFWTDSGAGSAGGSGGWHVVTITDYDAATGTVSVDNQWGSSVDHTGKNAVSISDLYAATYP